MAAKAGLFYKEGQKLPTLFIQTEGGPFSRMLSKVGFQPGQPISA
jgi:hypothetical protein